MIKKIHINLFIIIFLIILFFFNKHQNISLLNENSLCSVKYDNITVYHGPNTSSNKARIILKKGYPVFILQKKQNWIKIKDYQNKEGWIQKSNLSNETRGMITKTLEFSEENITIEKGASVKIISTSNKHCIIEVNKQHLKVNKQNIWLGS